MFHILDFIDSKDIREHNANTQFTPMEQAVLIYHSVRTTVDDKMTAWRELLERYGEDDFKILNYGERQFVRRSNRQLVEDTVRRYEAALSSRYTASNVIFAASFEEIGHPRPDELSYFTDYDSAFAFIEAEKQSYFDDEDLQDRLIAAYCIGWMVTEEDLERYPHLKMAESDDDTGVIISFNSEAENIEASIIVPRGVRTLSINPLNWKTDSTYADRSLNKGACFTDYSGSVTSEIPYLTGAYIDPERGTLRVMDVNPSDYSSPLFPDEVYHLYDYQFFFRNLQENVAIRTASWIEQHESLSLGNAS